MTAVNSKVKNALFADFKKDAEEYWGKCIPVVDDFMENCEAYLEKQNAKIMLQHDLLQQQCYNIVWTIQKYNVFCQSKKIKATNRSNVKMRVQGLKINLARLQRKYQTLESKYNENLEKIYKLPEMNEFELKQILPQSKLDPKKSLINKTSNLTKNPNSKTKLPSIRKTKKLDIARNSTKICYET